MPTLEQERDVRNQLKATLDELAGINAAELVRDKELGPGLNFESGVIFFSRTLRLFHGLHEADLQDVSHQTLSQLLGVAAPALQNFRNIKTFSLQNNPSNPIAERDNLINAVRDQYDEVFRIVSPVVAFMIRKGTDFARLEDEARAALQRIESFSTEQTKALEKARLNAEELVKEVRRIAQESGVSQESIHFKTEADHHETSAKKWLLATIVLGVLTLAAGVASWIFFSLNIKELSGTQNLQLTVSKIIILSLMFSATLWAGRTYRAHRHNAVVNRHRQNALSTFKAFVEATTDEPTKNAVLLQATQCIFAPQQTGYVTTGESDSGGIPQVLEIVRTLGKSS